MRNKLAKPRFLGSQWNTPNFPPLNKEKNSERNLYCSLNILAVLALLGYVFSYMLILAVAAGQNIVNLGEDFFAFAVSLSKTISSLIPFIFPALIAFALLLAISVLSQKRQWQKARKPLSILAIIAFGALTLSLLPIIFLYLQYATGILVAIFAAIGVILFVLLRQVQEVSRDRCSLLFSYIGMLLAIDSIGIAILLQMFSYTSA